MGMAAVEKHEFKMVLGIWFCPLLCDVLTGQWIKRALDGHQEDKNPSNEKLEGWMLSLLMLLVGTLLSS